MLRGITEQGIGYDRAGAERCRVAILRSCVDIWMGRFGLSQHTLTNWLKSCLGAAPPGGLCSGLSEHICKAWGAKDARMGC